MISNTETLQIALEALELPSLKTAAMLLQRDKAIAYVQEALGRPEQTFYQPAANEAVEILKSFGYVYEPRCTGLAWVAKKPAQPEQEPVAYYHPHKGFYWSKPTYISAPTVVDAPPLPLYTAPPAAQREWQGLTDDDWVEIGSRKNTVLDTFACGAAWAADQLEERNT